MRDVVGLWTPKTLVRCSEREAGVTTGVSNTALRHGPDCSVEPSAQPLVPRVPCWLKGGSLRSMVAAHGRWRDGRRRGDPEKIMKNNVGIRVCKKVGDSGGIRYLAKRCIASVQII